MAPDGHRARRPDTARVLLQEISLQRDLRDQAYEAAEHPKAAWLESGELMRRAQGSQDALEAVILQALGDASPPGDDEIADAAGISPQYLLELKVRIGLAEAPEPEAVPRRRWFRR